MLSPLTVKGSQLCAVLQLSGLVSANFEALIIQQLVSLALRKVSFKFEPMNVIAIVNMVRTSATPQ